MYDVSAQGIDECMTNIHYYYYYCQSEERWNCLNAMLRKLLRDRVERMGFSKCTERLLDTVLNSYSLKLN